MENKMKKMIIAMLLILSLTGCITTRNIIGASSFVILDSTDLWNDKDAMLYWDIWQDHILKK